MWAPQELAGIGVEHGLDETLGIPQRDRLAVADEGGSAPTLILRPEAFAFASVMPTLATCGQQ